MTIPALLNDAAGLTIQDARDHGAPLHVARERFLNAASEIFDQLANPASGVADTRADLQP